MAERIVIDRLDDDSWVVRCDGRHSGRLCWEEMLGVMAARSVRSSVPKCLGWLKTPEQHAAEDAHHQERLREINVERELRERLIQDLLEGMEALVDFAPDSYQSRNVTRALAAIRELWSKEHQDLYFDIGKTEVKS